MRENERSFKVILHGSQWDVLGGNVRVDYEKWGELECGISEIA